MKLIKDLIYTDTRDYRNRYDLYLADGADTLLIYFYGGSLKKGSKEKQKLPICAAECGISVAMPDYRLIPDVAYPAFINDAADAVAKILSEHAKGVKKVFIGGHSAGAYLSMMLCFDRHYLNSRGVDTTLINGYCFISGMPVKHMSVLEQAGDDPRRIVVDDTSALYYVKESQPPVLIMTSDSDLPNRREQNLLLRGTLEAFGNGGHTVYVEIDGCAHGAFVRPDENGHIPALPYILDFTKKF